MWALHWLLRLALAIALLPYAWTKVFHTQMGYADYADALVQYGEMSPMGLLWRFMAFSPTVQALAGAAELIAVVLLLFRRTAWLGALIAAMDMSIVFLLNLTFDVPVKQLSGAMALAGLVLLIPNVPRVVRFVLGRAMGPAVSGVISHNRIFAGITRWASPILAVIIIVGSGCAVGIGLNWGRPGDPAEISGVYAAETAGQASAIKGTDHTTDDITQIAFGQIGEDTKRMSIRYDDGDYQDGTYTVDKNRIAVKLFPIRKGAQGLMRDYSGSLEFTADKIGEGQFSLRTGDTELTLSSDAERRFLFDRGFRWGPETPINR
ncbi:DoxX family protein [Brevibacterium oceani]|uniref:DoxX family protein n=1 Tax=Brevibacterium oceani TaxID=358099 RepID=UPI001B32A1C9|nr:DoxX family protein [Brevibacterium oceani]